MDKIIQIIKNLSQDFPQLIALSFRLITAALILFLGWLVARWLRTQIRKMKIAGRELDPTLKPIIASALFYSIMAMALYAALDGIGVPAASLLAGFGAAGLAIALALRDTLSNIASGVMLLILRPLSIGDYIDTGLLAGTVIEIGLFSTTIKSIEGTYIYAPNGQVWTQHIHNYGRHKIRKAIITLALPYEVDLKQAQTILLGALTDTPDALLGEDAPSTPECYITDFTDYAVNISCRVWLPADNWLERSSNLRLSLKTALSAHNIALVYLKPENMTRRSLT